MVGLLLAHAAGRGGGRPGDAVFRTRRGEPVTARRYDRLFARARHHLGWDERTPLSAHVLRHTAVTRIGRIAGYPVAQAFAGHAPPTVTGRYLHATLADVATAVAVLTGEAHPIAHPIAPTGASTCPGSRR
ncbi:MAG: tyrosine-type recombinase/integrase [Acidimicrobiales bacterium]|nr:tyrosine-type recombinase/integrase [Acidimicrobiales bacterium]